MSFENCAFDMIEYPAGELQVRLKPEVIEMFESKKVNTSIITCCYKSDRDLFALAQSASAAEYLTGPGSALHIIMPYLPYSRADRRFVPGDSFGLEVLGNFLAALAPTSVITLDVHSPVAKLKVPNLINVSPDEFIVRAALGFEINFPSDQINLLLPDEGAAKRYKPEVQPVGCNTHATNLVPYQATKHRDPATGRLSGFSLPPTMPLDKPTLIVDDICDGGGTFAGLAALFPEKTPLGLYVSHGIFSKGWDPLARFDKIYTTNSFEQTAWMPLTVFDCGPLLRKAVPVI